MSKATIDRVEPLLCGVIVHPQMVPYRLHFGDGNYDYLSVDNNSGRVLRITVEEIFLVPDTAEYDSW